MREEGTVDTFPMWVLHDLVGKAESIPQAEFF
jgi:hypothetical protein